MVGKDWATERFDKVITQALIKTKSAKYLYLAERDWTAGRISNTLAKALHQIGDPNRIRKAKTTWERVGID